MDLHQVLEPVVQPAIVSQRTDTLKSSQYSSGFMRGGGVVVVLVAVWAQFIWQLRTEWALNDQYAFGFWVPLLIVVLLACRWRERPQSTRCDQPRKIWAILALGFGLLLPLRICEEANPDWPPLFWVHAALAVGLTAIVLHGVGGPEWPRHFLPPLLLIFFAVPWPVFLEDSAIQSLSRLTASGASMLLSIFGVPALQVGNVIRVPTGLVGVEEACSGIRSLAGILMSSYFFGEFYRLSLIRRFTLVIAGIALAVGLNLARTFLLCWVGATKGIATIADWHDPAGYGVLVLGFVLLWFSARLLVVHRRHSPVPARGGTSSFRTLRAPVLVAIVIWIPVIEILNETWYRRQETDLLTGASWEPAWPRVSEEFRLASLSPQVQRMLRYSEGVSAVLKDREGPDWHIFYFKWEPKTASSHIVAMHRPEVCLPSVGFRLISEAAPIAQEIQGIQIAFTCSIFEVGGKKCHVFRSIADERVFSGPGKEYADIRGIGRLVGAWHGRRNLGQRTLQIAILGCESFEEARADLANRLPKLIRVTTR